MLGGQKTLFFSFGTGAIQQSFLFYWADRTAAAVDKGTHDMKSHGEFPQYFFEKVCGGTVWEKGQLTLSPQAFFQLKTASLQANVSLCRRQDMVLRLFLPRKKLGYTLPWDIFCHCS